MKYKYVGNTEMTVCGLKVKKKGDIIDIDKELNHQSFIRIDDENIRIQVFSYGGKK